MSFVIFARRIVLLVGLLLLFVCGVDLLFRTPSISSTIGVMVPWVSISNLDEVGLMVLGGVAWLIPFFYLALVLMERRLSRGIVGKGSGGEELALTPESIERAVVRHVKGEVDEVLKVRGCVARQAGPTVGITLRVAVSDSVPVSEAQRRVKAAALQAIEQKIGITNNPRVSVKITDVIGKSKDRPARKKAKPGKPSTETE